MTNHKLSPSIQLALAFVLFGAVWIIFAGRFFVHLPADNLSRRHILVDVLFVLSAALFIFFAGKKMFARQEVLQRQLAEERIRYKDALAQEVFSAQELERKKLGEELHDNINQLLGVVKLYIEHAQMDPAARDEMLKKSAGYLRQVIAEIRGLSKSLIMPTLNDVGLMESVQDLIENICDLKKINIELSNVNFTEQTVSDIKKLMIYRILQEQLNNIVKHSHAENVAISLERSDAQLLLSVEDDGVGFDTTKIKTGLGLKNIRHRLELINGSMKVESSPGKGCRLAAAFDI